MAANNVEKCENTKSIVLYGRSEARKIGLFFNPRCQSWTCDYCAEVKKEEWIHQAARGSSILWGEGNQLQFVTLTSRGYATPNKSIYFFKKNWPKMRKRIGDRTKEWAPFTGIEWAYFMVPERHKSGVLHVHLIASTHITSEKVWKEHAFKSGFGYIIDVQELITPLLAATYVAKYLHKGAGAEDWPKHFRRVRHSQNWPIAHDAENVEWVWETLKKEQDVWIEKMALLDMGWKVIDKREDL